MKTLTTISEVLDYCSKHNKPMSEVFIEIEAKRTGKTTDEVFEHMRKMWHVMKESIEKGIRDDSLSPSGLSGGDAKRMWDSPAIVAGDVIRKAIARAMAVSEVNAKMGRIVAAPTAGSSGILPAALYTAAEELNVDENSVIRGLFVAAGLGIVISLNASLAGATGGCQAECGSAAGMAAAAIVEMAGGTPEQSAHALAISLKNVLGLVCDPVATLVEVPCVKRNAMGVVNALASAEMALHGVKSKIPPDEVIVAMSKIGRELPESLRETGEGGLAGTPTGRKLRKQILGY